MHPERGRMCMAVSNPEAGKYGDCIRACIATLIDRDDVPHPFSTAENTVAAWGVMRSYLAQHGKNIAIFAIDEHFQFMKETNPGVAYMMMHETHRGAHAVVCQDGAVLFDPAFYRSEIVGPLKTVNGYIVGIITEVI